MIARADIKRNVRRLVSRKDTIKRRRRLRYWRGVDERLTARKLRIIERYFRL